MVEVVSLLIIKSILDLLFQSLVMVGEQGLGEVAHGELLVQHLIQPLKLDNGHLTISAKI